MCVSHPCMSMSLTVTEMLVNVLNIHSEDDDNEPTDTGRESEVGGVSVRVGWGPGLRGVWSPGLRGVWSPGLRGWVEPWAEGCGWSACA